MIYMALDTNVLLHFKLLLKSIGVESPIQVTLRSLLH